MQRLLFTALACLLSVSLSAQRLTESNLHSHITYCFEEYISLELTKNVVNLENGEKFFVEVRIEDVSWFHLNIFLIDGELQMIGSIIEGMIDADVFSNDLDSGNTIKTTTETCLF